MKEKTKKPSGYVVIDYLRAKHPEWECTYELSTLDDGGFEQARIVIGDVFVSQRSSVFNSSADSVLFKSRSDSNKRFMTKLSNLGSSSYDTLDTKVLERSLSAEILNLIQLFNL